MATRTFSGHIDQVFAAMREWQGSLCTWAEAVRRADVSRAGEKILKEKMSRMYTDALSVRRIATEAVAAE